MIRMPHPGRTGGSDGFEISHRGIDERTSVVVVEGEVDLATAPRLKWTLLDLLAAGRNQLVVDLSRVSFVDSTGLGVLVGVRKKLGAEGRLAISGVQASASKIFEVTGLHATLNVFDTLDAAVSYAQGGAAPVC